MPVNNLNINEVININSQAGQRGKQISAAFICLRKLWMVCTPGVGEMIHQTTLRRIGFKKIEFRNAINYETTPANQDSEQCVGPINQRE